MYPEKPVLLVDDEPILLRGLRFALHTAKINNVEIIEDPREVMGYLLRNEVSLVVLDINMPYMSGDTLLENIKSSYPQVPVIILTGGTEVDMAVKCMKVGAYDYMLKPVEEARLISGVRNALDLVEAKAEMENLRGRLFADRLDHPEAFSAIVGESRVMRNVFQYLESIAGMNRPVLIMGETGVGKELAARAIHTVSDRKGEFVPVNLAGLDDTLFSDSLFGHVKGAYTGAEDTRSGFIEKANGGTIFFDEIGDLEMTSQIKLLRLLQEGNYYPLGCDSPKTSTARVVAATNQDLGALVRSGKFRKDLYYRLCAHSVEIPPLRKRKEDIHLLVDHFLEVSATAMGKRVPTPPSQLYTLLENYHFPGNVRELQGLLENAIGLHKGGVLSLASFSRIIEPQAGFESEDGNGGEKGVPVIIPEGGAFPTLKDTQEFLVAEALSRAEGNQTMAAKLLGISRHALNKRLLRSE